MILLDEEGTMIHGKVMKHMVNKFRPLIREGLVYMISNFKVMSAMNFRPVESEKVLNFLHMTKIQEIKGQKKIKIAEQSLTFRTVEVLSTRDSQKIYLSDVIGIASYIGHIEETHTTHGISKIRDIVLRIEDQKINIRLWGNKVGQIDEDSLGRVVIVTSTNVRKLKEYSLSSTGATRVYIDLDIPETNELQTRYCLQDDMVEEIEPEAHLQGTIQEQVLYNRRTLKEITEITYESEKQEKFYTAEAMIKSINTSHEWYYIGCRKCNKKVQKQGNHFYYPKCEKEPEKICPRYKLKLEICDLSATTTCTMFEAEAKKLIKQSASVLIERDDCDIHEQTKQIQKICGQRLIFQFRLNDYNLKYDYQEYTVHRIFFIDSEKDTSVNHSNVEQEQADKLSVMKAIKQELEDGEPTINWTKRGRRSSTTHVVHLDEEPKTEGSQEIMKSKSMEAGPKRKRAVTRKCAGIDRKQVKNDREEESEHAGTVEHNDSRPRTRRSCVNKELMNKEIQKCGVSRTRKSNR
ncbi:uncharacterized protein [Triticum aestivum]|uniref:uncharacterized protein isoform X3 n=1 Tax=Triticum aestivum TaxID=4565 RepID=UPI001D034BB5|nr:uncharacterized protein LOC123116107 isoform X3 [Triticum aestivum]